MNFMIEVPAFCQQDAPRDWATLPQTLTDALIKANQDAKLTFIDQQGRAVVQTYQDLVVDAQTIASGLRKSRIEGNSPVLIQLTSSEEIIKAFWGCLFSGLQPIISPVPESFDSESRPVDQLRHLYSLMDRPAILSNSEHMSAIRRSPLLSELHDADFFDLNQLRQASNDRQIHCAKPDDIAFFTLSSGSTGLPKAIPLSHSNMITRGRGANILCKNQSDDVILSWLPFDHIGNISAYHVSPILCSSDLVYAPKEYVLAKPTRWLDLIDKYRITHSWAPNFAFGLITKQLQKNDRALDQHWDLSCLKGLLSAGELISHLTVRSFVDETQRYGLKPNSVISAFGMAEVCSGVNYHLPASGDSIQFAHLDRNSLDGDISLLTPEDPKSISFANLGPIAPGMAMRIVDSSGQLKNEGQVGQFQLKGDGLMRGYYKNPEANEVFTEDGWFDTGDAAFILDKNLYLLGRTTLGIVINGVNLSNHDVESVVEELEDVTPSFTAACAAFPPNEELLKLVVFFHTSLSTDPIEFSNLKRQIQGKLGKRLGIRADYLIPLPQGSIPKTAIGKIQHKRLITQFQSGNFNSIISNQKAVSVPSQKNEVTGLAGDLVEIWSELLPGVEIKIEDSFFEMGADSLVLMQALGSINDRVDTQITVVDLFKYPTISALTQALETGQSTIATEKARSRLKLIEDLGANRNDAIAVIGMAGRFPGADSIEEFWGNLLKGEDSITRFDEKDLSQSGFSRGVYDRPEYVMASPLLKDARRFDAEFFGYSSFDAELMDPQQRQFLEIAWETFENAGYDPTTYPGSVGVYAGAAMNTYFFNNVLPNRSKLDPNDDLAIATLDSMGGFMAMVANDKDYITTRTSYKLNLDGPSVNVQTACSTGLVCIHMACQALKSGEADLFLAGCSSIQSPEYAGHLYQPGMIVSPDGRVRSFDANAGGTIFGSGVGAVLLKRLSEAERDGDHIHAVIKGSAVNNDAGAKVGYAAPSSDGQAIAIAEALTMANVPADSIGMVEAHGTGTVVGDPIEFDGLRQVYQNETESVGFCALGSVKTNVGHLQITSGTAGFIKAALAVSKGKIPPLVNFEIPNPALDIEESPFFFNSETIDWPIEGPRRAGVNSLGIGGTNAHLILEQPPEPSPRDLSSDRKHHLLRLSAKTPAALSRLAGRYQEFLSGECAGEVGDYCFTANIGRKLFAHRLCVSGRTNQELAKQLQNWIKDFNPSNAVATTQSLTPIAFVFTGQGSQYVAIARDLYLTQSTFRNALDDCANHFSKHMQIDVIGLATDVKLTQTDLLPTDQAQPLIFSIGYALAQMWMSWGVTPDYILGHILGEYIAACVAGIFSIEDAVKLVSLRASLMQATTAKGEMWAIHCDAKTARHAIKDQSTKISLAADNAPNSVVISGNDSALKSIINDLKNRSIVAQKLETSHAFHSPLMDEAKRAFEKSCSDVRFSLPQIPLISNLTGSIATEEITSLDYWAEHISRPVLFRQSIESLNQLGISTFLEIGPHPALSTLGLMCSSVDAKWYHSLNRKSENWDSIISTVSKLAETNDIDLKAFDRDYPRHKAELPTYPFDTTSYWLEPLPTQRQSRSQSNRSLLGKAIPLATVSHKIFESELDPIELPVLRDHLINNVPVVSAAGMMSMMLSAVEESSPENHRITLEEITFQKPLILSPESTLVSQTVVNPEDGKIELWSRTQSGDFKNLHCRSVSKVDSRKIKRISLDSLKAQFTDLTSIDKFLKEINDRHIFLGPSYRWTENLQKNKRAALATLKKPSRLGGQDSSTAIHPGLIDTCFGLLLATADLPKSQTWVPFGIDQLSCATGNLARAQYAFFELRDSDAKEIAVGDGLILDSQGDVLIEISGLHARPAESKFDFQRTEKNSSPSRYIQKWHAARPERTPASVGHWTLVGQTDWSSGIAGKLENAGCEVSVVETIDDLSKITNGVISSCALDQHLTTHEIIDQNRSLIKALAKKNVSLSNGLWLLTNNAYCVTGEELVDPQQTSIRGLCVGTRHEHPELIAHHLDITPTTQYQQIVDLVLCPLQDPCIALRGSENFIAKLSPQSRSGDQITSFHKDRTYIVTGAYGALGQQVTHWLIDRGVRHLLLLARKTPSPNPFKIVANDNVAIYDRSCDLGNFDELQEILKSTLPEIPTIAGLFHCAGQLNDEPLVDSTSSGFESVLNGKALGAQNLDTLLESQPLEQFVMFSSAASVLGNGGQSSYATANAFLDGVAHARKTRGLPALSINWGPFSGSGMATDESASRQLRMQGFQPLEPANLGVWLDAMLSEKSPQVMFVDCDWSQYCRVNPANISLLSDITEPGNPGAWNNPNSQKVDLQGQTPDERRKTLIDLVKGSVAGLLGIADPQLISHDKPLSDLGLDSLLAVQLRNQLGSATSLSLPVGLAFSYPTLNEMASYLDIRLSENEKSNVPKNSNNSETLQSAQATLDDLDELLKINP